MFTAQGDRGFVHSPSEAISTGLLHHATSNEQDLKEEWGYIMATVKDSTKASASNAKSISSTSSGFRIQLFTNQVFEARRSDKIPVNLKELERCLDCDRQSVSPDDEDALENLIELDQAVNEATLRHSVMQAVRKRIRVREPTGERLVYSNVYDQSFARLPKDVGFNNGLSAPQPDLASGFRWEAFKFNNVLAGIPGVIPHSDMNGISLPHLFGEFKRPGGDRVEGIAQAAYDGAYGVWARTQVLKEMQVCEVECAAHVFSFFTDGSFYAIYAHFQEGKKYYQYALVDQESLKQSPDSFRVMYQRLRNLQEMAYAEADALRLQIAKWQDQQPGAGLSTDNADARRVEHGNERARDQLLSPAASTSRSLSLQESVTGEPPKKRSRQ